MKAHDITRVAKGLLVERVHGAGEMTNDEVTMVYDHIARLAPTETEEAREAMVQQVAKQARVQAARVQIFLEVRQDSRGFWTALLKEDHKDATDADSATWEALFLQRGDAEKAERKAAKEAAKAAKSKKPSKPRVIVEDEDDAEQPAF